MPLVNLNMTSEDIYTRIWGARTNKSFKAEGFGSHLNDLRRLVFVNRLQNDSRFGNQIALV